VEVAVVQSSRIAVTLKAARQRLGWSREALAYRSGVSWSAISQIESGRRKDLRLSSLSAIADALGVSVDYLIGTAAAANPPHPFEHRVLTYASDEEFVAAAIPFLVEGIEQSHSLVAILTDAKTRLVRHALGDRSELVAFADWTEWYSSPREALHRYGELVKQKLEDGAVWIRVVAEAAWTGGTGAETAAWTRYESLVNLAFAASPATIMCTYDEQSFPAKVIADARRTHPEVADGSDITACPTYRDPADFLLRTR
jgi:transcriptional regulator with XRE-family HTH domain